MRFGICLAGTDKFGLARDMGYDYIEPQVSAVHDMDDTEFGAFKKALGNSGLKAEAFNVFIPKRLPLTGGAVDKAALRSYLEKAALRAAELGGEIIVFGSGGARNVPEGFPRDTATGQLLEFLNMAGDICSPYGIVIAIEPLRSQECNIINTVTDGYRLARLANHPGVRVLADNYHMHFGGEGTEGVSLAGSEYLRHVHVSHPSTREAPRVDDGADYRPLLKALSDIGYSGRISVEATMPRGFAADAVEALKFLAAEASLYWNCAEASESI